MTRGKSQIEKITDLKRLLNLQEMTIEDVKDIIVVPPQLSTADCLDEKRYPTLIAVKRDNGDCVKITIKELPSDRRSRSSNKWCLIEEDILPGKIYTDLDELAHHIDITMLPVVSLTHLRGIHSPIQTMQLSSDVEQ